MQFSVLCEYQLCASRVYFALRRSVSGIDFASIVLHSVFFASNFFAYNFSACHFVVDQHQV
jgi:hypothetical protein